MPTKKGGDFDLEKANSLCRKRRGEGAGEEKKGRAKKKTTRGEGGTSSRKPVL